jgi:hypothetical protein
MENEKQLQAIELAGELISALAAGRYATAANTATKLEELTEEIYKESRK